MSENVRRILVFALVFIFASTMVTYAEDPKTAEAIKGSAAIDGDAEAAWNNAAPITIDLALGGAATDTTGTAKAMWDESNLYLLINVSDPALDDANGNPWEKDSVEIYIDQNNGKTDAYESDDIQLRINYKNEISSGGAYYDAIKDTLKSAAKVVDGGYILEAAVPWTSLEAKEGAVIGFDLQINAASGGKRDFTVMFNDPTGNSWANTSQWGLLRLTAGGAAGLPTTGSSIPIYVLYGLAGLLVIGGIVFQVRKLALNK